MLVLRFQLLLNEILYEKYIVYVYYNVQYDVILLFFLWGRSKGRLFGNVYKSMYFSASLNSTWINCQYRTNLNDFHFNEYIVLHCLVAVNSQGKKIIMGCKLPLIFRKNMQNNGFHANNGATTFVIIVHLLYRQIHSANCNIISISDKSFQTCGSCMTIHWEWMNQWILHDVYKLYYAINQSNKFVHTMLLAHSFTQIVDCNNRSWLFKVCSCFAMLFVCLCCFAARELIANEFLWRQFRLVLNDD